MRSGTIVWVTLFFAAHVGCGSDTPRYVLINYEERAKANPDTLKLPPRADREALTAGRVVLLYFQSADGRPAEWNSEEGMWVTITEVTGGPRFIGMVDRNPKLTPDLKKGDRIQFGPEHIAEIAPQK